MRARLSARGRRLLDSGELSDLWWKKPVPNGAIKRTAIWTIKRQPFFK